MARKSALHLALAKTTSKSRFFHDHRQSAMTDPSMIHVNCVKPRFFFLEGFTHYSPDALCKSALALHWVISALLTSTVAALILRFIVNIVLRHLGMTVLMCCRPPDMVRRRQHPHVAPSAPNALPRPVSRWQQPLSGRWWGRHCLQVWQGVWVEVI